MKHVILAVVVSCALAHTALAQTAADTLPSGGTVAAGAASIVSFTPTNARLQINQSTQNAVINWVSFSIGSAASVHFSQPGASAVVLNRVIGGSPSQIFGRLTANGKVFLSNPSGVLFAPGASVEAGALLATTLSITDQDFLAGRYTLRNDSAGGTVVNRGSIMTPSGYAVLAGPQVRNEGLIIAQLGSVALAAGDRVTLNMVEGSLIGVSVDPAALSTSVLNSGTIQADGGRVILTANAANGLLDTVIHTGTIRANRLEERDGQIVLQGGANGIVRSIGILDADSIVIDGGEVYVTGVPGLPAPPGPVLAPNPGRIVADPDIPQIRTSTPSVLPFEPFSVSAAAALQFAQPTGSLPVQAGTHTGTIPIAPAHGTLGLNDNIGPLSPLPVQIHGAGVSGPPEGLTAFPASQ